MTDYEIKANVLWNVLITSHASTHGLSIESIDYIMNSHKHPEYVDFKESSKKSFEDSSFSKESVAVWQINKSDEMENSFYDNMSYTIDGDLLNFRCEYQVKLTEEFEIGDVVSWAQGLNKIAVTSSMVQMMDMAKGDTKENIIHNSDNITKSRKVINELKDNEDIRVDKI